MPKFLTQEDFIEKAVAKHGTKYDYSTTVYTASKNNITYKCNSCNSVITQRAGGHLEGYGCSKCGQEERKNKIKFSWKHYKNIASKLHNDYYNYDSVTSRQYQLRNNYEQESTIIVHNYIQELILFADIIIAAGVTITLAIITKLR